jgi:hypothetical protein
MGAGNPAEGGTARCRGKSLAGLIDVVETGEPEEKLLSGHTLLLLPEESAWRREEGAAVPAGAGCYAIPGSSLDRRTVAGRLCPPPCSF